MLGILILLLVLTSYLYLNKDKISERLLLSSSKNTRGELVFESIAFNPFIQFPSMSMLIRGLEYYENPIHARNQNEKPIAGSERVYGAIDVRELMHGRLVISRIMLERGKICLIQYPDSSLNFMNAMEKTGLVPHKKDIVD